MVGGWKLVIKVNTSHGESWWTGGFFFSFWAATRARTSGRHAAVSDKPLLLQQWTTILAVRHCWLVAVHLQTASAGKVVNNVSQFARTRETVSSTVWHTFPGIKRSFLPFFSSYYFLVFFPFHSLSLSFLFFEWERKRISDLFHLANNLNFFVNGGDNNCDMLKMVD